MWQNSTELLDYALRELQVAVANNKQMVEIVLSQAFPNDYKKVKELCDTLEIKTITELLREELCEYEIRSEVATEDFSMNFMFVKGPCEFYYKLLWKLTLRKK